MSIEEILLSAEDHGKRTDVLKMVGLLRQDDKSTPLQELYEKAYETVMKV
jgi:hypothetical protein